MFQHHGFVDSNGEIGGTKVVFYAMVWYYELAFKGLGLVGLWLFLGCSGC